MSSIVNKSNKTSNIVSNKFCKVCCDAGKDESVYTSHFVKSDPVNGVIVCPTLKALECRYCKKKGHTIKFCKALQEKDKLSKRVYSLENPTTPKLKKCMNNPKTVFNQVNAFDVLFSDSDEDNDDEEQEEYPIISYVNSGNIKNVTNTKASELKGWAAIVATPVSSNDEEINNEKLKKRVMFKIEDEEKPIENVVKNNYKLNRPWKSWADDSSDSDLDDLDDDEHVKEPTKVMVGLGAW